MPIASSHNKYSLLHPKITPEYYKPLPSHEPFIKALYISSDPLDVPCLITDTSDSIIQLIFSKQTVKTLHPNDYFHICFSADKQYGINKSNFIASHLVRNTYLTSLGIITTDAIYGDVVIFGSYNYKEKIVDDEDHSVPYEIVEQVLRIYDIRSKYQKTLP